MTEPQGSSFVRGNEHLDRILSDPDIAAGVAQAHEAAEEMDRTYAMNLAMIRKAGRMTQVEVAKKLGVGQGVVSRLENCGDMLLSTLFDYLMATGAESAGIVVTVRGRRIELDLGRLRHPHTEQRRSA
ncbi:helix-turn-helix domain-containing protein [Microbispora sp. ZYX-F-249]|uniref:Helix-turn-helix domain-containing protein n=1 Tax=Microbispora maris TaxID=3144104 RepID=A0ABV0AVJ7_9ACTN